MAQKELPFNLVAPEHERVDTVKTRSGNHAIDDDHHEALQDATVVMVDDEPTTIEVLQAFLENEGYERFVTTSDSTQAMELITNEHSDVVLLDLNMPEVSGFDILNLMRVHNRLRYIPVIVLTSSNDSETKLKALQLGASDFLAKPVDPSELALRLRNTLAAKAYQDRLTNYDALTGLPNRRMFMDRLIWSIRCANRDHTAAAVLHVGLDYFKKINDTLGHAVGDRLLTEVAHRLAGYLPVTPSGSKDANESQPMLARVGGDEFNILLPEVEHIENAALLAASILGAMQDPFHIDHREVFITPSIGVAVFPEDGESGDTLLKHAGIALNQTKQCGRNNYQFYSPAMNAKALERLSMANHLRRALEREELIPVYQPKVDIQSGRIVGSEVLLRWHHPELGWVSPAEFIPLAEETGLIVAFGAWILRAASQQNKAWQSAGFADIRIAVNVSAQQFRNERFIQTIAEALEDSGLEPQYLTLEITANAIMENTKGNLELLGQIKATGVKLSVDDFGTGYSSLSYLKKLPLDELKIDRSFISEIRSETDNAPIVTAIVAMAHSLSLKVVIEGIETKQQLVFASAQHCDEYQGFLFSKRVESGEFETLLAGG